MDSLRWLLDCWKADCECGRLVLCPRRSLGRIGLVFRRGDVVMIVVAVACGTNVDG